MKSTTELQSELILNLQKPEAYTHPGGDVDHLETHISHIILFGDYAYKIKKPLDLGFLDFSTLEKRRFFCAEELRLNRRLAREIYLAVVPITGTPGHPVMGGRGPALEYAVKMRRFPQAALLSRVALNKALMAQIARQAAAFHARIPVVEMTGSLGTAAAVFSPVEQNFQRIRAAVGEQLELNRLDHLERWSRGQFERLKSVLQQRRIAGFVRECHGDMHLGNMVLIDNEVVIFDGIEFSSKLRWIDTISEVAFLVMDLEHRGEVALGWHFLNAYLEASGDYEGLVVLRFYQVYRAMVRAKVAAIRLRQMGASDPDRNAVWSEYISYIGLAERFTRALRPGMIITAGVSGSGKSTLTDPLAEQLPAIRLRSDIERKRLFQLPPNARTGAGRDQGIYQPQATEATYDRLRELAEAITGAGYTVIVDATFLKQAQRDLFRVFALARGLPFLLLEFHAPVPVLRERVAKRQAESTDASEADIAVLESQLARREPLSEDEKQSSLSLNSAAALPLQQVVERWKQVSRIYSPV